MQGNVRKTDLKAALCALAVFVMSWLLISVAVGLKNVFVLRISGAGSYISAVVATAVLLFAFAVYFANTERIRIDRIRELAAVVGVLTVSVILNVYLSIMSVYLMPIALSAFIVVSLSNSRDSFACNLMSNLMTGVILLLEVIKLPIESVSDTIMPIVAILAAGTASGALVSFFLGGETRRLLYIGKGLLIGLASAGILSAVSAARGEAAGWVLTYRVVCAIVQVLAAQLLQPVFEVVFNLITDSRLLELTDRRAPLMQRLSQEAPGTFNHVMTVSNFAEQCAAAIGENPYLARASAYYHDVGKLVNPEYFTENQSDYNPHDEVLPEVSAEIIREHTKAGYDLCMQYRIPKVIADVAVEHQGTLPITLFYEKAKRLTDSAVNIADYSYNGRTPRSKIAAIIMICDSGEAAIRAMDKPNGARVNALIKSLIDSRVEAGQFDDCDISLRDLTVIRQTIVNAYGGVFHHRIKYTKGNH